ncbi:MAG: hypothetical protein ACXVXN_06535 [Mycobacteriaceae bacterium]
MTAGGGHIGVLFASASATIRLGARQSILDACRDAGIEIATFMQRRNLRER